MGQNVIKLILFLAFGASCFAAPPITIFQQNVGSPNLGAYWMFNKEYTDYVGGYTVLPSTFSVNIISTGCFFGSLNIGGDVAIQVAEIAYNQTWVDLFDSEFSITMWVYCDSIPQPWTRGIFFDKPFTSHVDPAYQIRLGIDVTAIGNYLHFIITNNAVHTPDYLTCQSAANAPVAQKWMFIAATCSIPNTRAYLYKNAVLLASDTTASGAYTNHNHGASFGDLHNSQSGRNQTFDGKLDDICFYNRELKADEIYDIYYRSFRCD